MPTIITHAAVPIAFGYGLGKDIVPPRLVYAGIIASIIPDLDVIGFRFGIQYSSYYGHRGFTHSHAFAIALGIVAAIIANGLRAKRLNSFLFVTLAAASHGLLDMFTNGGLGVALLWPYSSERMFFPWRVINVSPLTLWQFLGLRGYYVILSELLWVWLPAAVVFIFLAVTTSSKKGKT